MQYHLAIDIGASSGRHIIGWLDKSKIQLEEVYRFDNELVKKNGHLCWDMDALLANCLEGMRACKQAGKIPSTLGIDTWAVDFVLLDKEGKPLGDTIAYRDSRTSGMDRLVEELISPLSLYSKTGIQKQSFNTIYQLMAIKQRQPELLDKADCLLMVPDFLHYCLTGLKRQEYTNATSTSLVNAKTKDWDGDLLNILGYPKHIFPPLVKPGAMLGELSQAIKQQVGFTCTVTQPATHDTACAFLAVPVQNDTSVYISSGTWSLLGVENKEPILTPDSLLHNFTNEGGFDYRFRYLKNIMGLWMIQSVRRDLNKAYSYAELESMARACRDFASVVDVNDPAFLAPASMIDAIKEYCAGSGQAVPTEIGEVVQCVYKSLAGCYAASVNELSSLTGKSYTNIHVVGGGTKDSYLSQLTATATGLPVFAGPTEGTALGNLVVQWIAAGELSGLDEARQYIRDSFPIQQYTPQEV